MSFTSGSDTFYSTDPIFTEAYASGGDDYLYGNGGVDYFFGESGNDWLYGNGGDDVLSGGLGNDHLYGGTGDDLVVGYDGNDYLDGGSGDNLLRGGLGDDYYVSGLLLHGNDTVSEKKYMAGGITTGGGYDVIKFTDVAFNTGDSVVYRNGQDLWFLTEEDLITDGINDNGVIVEGFFYGGDYMIEEFHDSGSGANTLVITGQAIINAFASLDPGYYIPV